MYYRALSSEEVDKIIEALKEGKPRHEIVEELGLPYHIKPLIPPERLEEYKQACQCGRTVRYKHRLAILKSLSRIKCPNCGIVMTVRTHPKKGYYVECTEEADDSTHLST